MVIIWLMMVNNIWLVVEPYPSEKYDFVSWDDDIPNWMENKKNVPKHQPELQWLVVWTLKSQYESRWLICRSETSSKAKEYVQLIETTAMNWTSLQIRFHKQLYSLAYLALTLSSTPAMRKSGSSNLAIIESCHVATDRFGVN